MASTAERESRAEEFIGRAVDVMTGEELFFGG